ncbi:hypothetical protein KAMFAM_125 [Bacillus phage Kamfam]|nr:hypothetical protein OTK52_123 [Bacillus phage OTooleKemple52]AXQ67213.1 hypothetical protein KAMFAM_125 [Bacillus phage Kamfam]
MSIIDEYRGKVFMDTNNTDTTYGVQLYHCVGGVYDEYLKAYMLFVEVFDDRGLFRCDVYPHNMPEYFVETTDTIKEPTEGEKITNHPDIIEGHQRIRESKYTADVYTVYQRASRPLVYGEEEFFSCSYSYDKLSKTKHNYMYWGISGYVLSKTQSCWEGVCIL